MRNKKNDIHVHVHMYMYIWKLQTSKGIVSKVEMATRWKNVHTVEQPMIQIDGTCTLDKI